MIGFARASTQAEGMGKLRLWETSVLAMGKGVTKGHFVLRYWRESWWKDLGDSAGNSLLLS